MTEESGKKRAVVVFQSDTHEGQQVAYTEDDEAWTGFLENPLTIASKAMMSVNGDDDSASALGMLYDYYKVPREKKATCQGKTEGLSDVDPNKINFTVPYQDSLAVTHLRNVPLHTVVRGTHQNQSKEDPYSATDLSVSMPAFSGGVLDSSLHSFPAGQSGLHSSQTDGVALSRHLSQSHYSPRAQTIAPDSTYIEPYKDCSAEVFPLSEAIQLRVAPIDTADYITPFSSSESQPFEYILEAPQSLRPKSATGPMSYLNKGQFYPISLRDVGSSKILPQHKGRVRSVIMLVFGNDKFTDDQLTHWRYWHSRQHTAKQRCLDIADYKESFNTITNIEEIAYNAISFTWDTRNEARIFVSVNCLSTDFSPQKGVRGLPLNLQIDTYICTSHGDKLVHRASSQIKVFCDKGAERKIRDEERKQNRRKTKGLDAADEKAPLRYFEITMFKPVSDLESQPVLFIPEVQYSTSQGHPSACPPTEGEDGHGQKRLLYNTEEQFDFAPKRPRKAEPQRVLLYVRREAEEVFDALMLKTPTLSGLLEAVTEKYELPSEKIGRVYKRCKKGMLVNMDDNIIRHYANEDTFQILMEEVEGKLQLTFTEI